MQSFLLLLTVLSVLPHRLSLLYVLLLLLFFVDLLHDVDAFLLIHLELEYFVWGKHFTIDAGLIIVQVA